MNRFASIFVFIFFVSCSNNDAPDVSHIKIDIKTKRFEQDFFKLDTNNTVASLNQLIAANPGFGENFLGTILGADANWSNDTLKPYINDFIRSYKSVYDTSQIVFGNFATYEAGIRKCLQYVKHYFPQYKVPANIITYIGPLDGYGDILSDDAFIVGLHHHLGNQYTLYKTELVQSQYPVYISKRFEPAYIDVNCARSIIDDMYQEKNENLSLIQQMVEKGKRLFVMQKWLPKTAASKIIGYSQSEYDMCIGIERTIWDFFLQNNLLQTTEANMIKNYIGESPKTQELVSDKGVYAPGNIGSFAGWQIVKKYMDKNPSLSLEKLMNADPETIYQEAKYKP